MFWLAVSSGSTLIVKSPTSIYDTKRGSSSRKKGLYVVLFDLYGTLSSMESLITFIRPIYD